MRLSRLAAIASVYSASVPHVDADELLSGFDDFASWYRSNGGTLDDRVTIGYEPGTSVRGMIATAPIPVGTTLMHTPASIIFSAGVEGDDQCLVVAGIAKELEAGDQSKWHAYFDFDDSSGDRHIPTQWDRSIGSGTAIYELQGLPPSGDTHRHVDWYRGVCKGGEEPTDLDWKALMIFLTRAADIGLIPMYDLMNHHNGLINTKLLVEADESNQKSLSVVALTDISEGEPIFNTYARSGMESSVDVFNTYGFVDPYPQLWRWTDEQLRQLAESDRLHHSNRYGSNADSIGDLSDRLQFIPNSHHHEVLVISPTLAALLPTKHLSGALGNVQRSFEDWEDLIAEHHANLLSSHAQNLVNSAKATLDVLPTTVEEDEQMITDEKRRVEKATRLGSTVDVNKADAFMAIEYRLAFKKALRLTVEVGETETFMDDSEEEL